MPFYYDFEDIEWPEDDEDFWPEPTAEEYQYLPPEDLGGTPEPVAFVEPDRIVSEQELAADPGSVSGSVPPPGGRGLSGFLTRLLWKWLGGGSFLQQTMDQQADWSRRQGNLFHIVLPALREIGGTHIHCGYDGGNDEGFAWFRTLETADGVREKSDVIRDLAQAGLVPKLKDSGLVRDVPDYPQSDESHIESTLESIADEWGVLLLGSGFGTGAYQMYGAFTVDLEAHTITDDRDARMPTDGNLAFPTGNKE